MGDKNNENSAKKDADKIAESNDNAPKNIADPNDMVNNIKASSVITKLIQDEMKTSYLDYAMSVIVSRALPDVRDGLKPVHRRILYAMNELGLTHGKAYKKSARIVGEVLGKYHPHGDSAVYESMVRMAQTFSMRYLLVDGQGNFGSVDGDSAAAMRYTEARMSKMSSEMLSDIDKETVLFVDNFDGSEREPSVLPTKIPTLLINGSVGIAVGMATNIPPHNIREICSAAIKLIDKPDAEVSEIMQEVTGPDFPTGGIIFGRFGIDLAYKTGRGKIKVRAKTHIEEKANRTALIVDEIPYQVNKSDLIIEIADTVKNKIIEGISDIRDESDREGMRMVIELKKDANSEVVLNQLFKHTRLQTTQGIILLCLVDNIPRTLNIKEILEYFIAHRKDVVTKRTIFELKKAENQAHLLLGLKIAIENLDQTITIVKTAESVKVAKEKLIEAYSIDELQAQAILEMKLQKLTGLERDKLVEEYNGLIKKIAEYKEILESDMKKFLIIRNELLEMSNLYGDGRKTEIYDVGDEEGIDIEDLIEKEDDVVTVTHEGYIKRTSIAEYTAQGRGGKGVIATAKKDEDFVEQLFVANTHTYLLCFTNLGQVHWMKVYKIPEGARQGKGKAIVNLLAIGANEKITAIIPVKEFTEGHYLVLITKEGVIKKTLLSEYANPRNGGVKGVILDEGDELIASLLTDGNKEIMIATANGIASRFDEKDVRASGRVTRGSRGINLDENDTVVGAILAEANKTILTITESGYGKRTPIEEYRLIRRGGKGVINIQVEGRNGKVMGVMAADNEDELMVISKNGIMIRTRAQEISSIGRNTQGVRIMRLEDGDKVVSIAKVIKEDAIPAVIPTSAIDVNLIKE